MVTPINQSDISFDFSARFDAKNKVFEVYDKRVRNSFQDYQNNANLILPKGTERLNNDDDGKITLIGFEITPESTLYPSELLENKIFKLIGQAGLNISICKNDSLISSRCSSQNSNISFSTQTINPTITYFFNDSIIEISATDLVPNKKEFKRRNKGGIESTSDLSEGVIFLSFSDIITNQLDGDEFELSKKYLITEFSFYVANIMFSSIKLCENSMENYVEYYFKLPKNITKSEKVECYK